MKLQENILRLEAAIAAAAKRAGRLREEIGYVLVTKTVPLERIREAAGLGICELGENRVQELIQKQAELPETIHWHMIGHLQTNKVKQVVGRVVLIHSVDRPELVLEIEKQAKKTGTAEVNALIQVNSSGESSKFGVRPEDVFDLAAGVSGDSPLKIRGLMTIGPLTADAEKIRESFRLTRGLRDRLREKFPRKQWDILSMGMSGDYEIAVEEGATLLRIGSAVFGQRT
jgi:PLP dependent protein